MSESSIQWTGWLMIAVCQGGTASSIRAASVVVPRCNRGPTSPSTTRAWASDVNSVSFNSSSRSRPLMGKTAPLPRRRHYAGIVRTVNRSKSSWKFRQLGWIFRKYSMFMRLMLKGK